MAGGHVREAVQERRAPGAAEGRPLLAAHRGPHQTQATHAALEALGSRVPVPLTQRHSLVLMTELESNVLLLTRVCLPVDG